MVEGLFWLSALLLLHTYFLYPLSLVLLDGWTGLKQALGTVRGKDRRPSPTPDGRLPRVSVVTAAYNEESCIGEKVSNTLALDYPADKLELLVGSDGSTDGTEARVLAVNDSRVRLSRGERAGKTTVLNRCIPVATGDIVVLTDANTKLDAGALRALVRHFEDPEVGVVCGRLRLFNPASRQDEESTYWSYETVLKLYEGRHGAVMGANGGLYAIRRVLFTQLPPSTIVDDFVIPLRILEKGYKIVYEPDAVAHEETTGDTQHEFGRRTRIAAGNFQSLKLLPGLLSPLGGFPAYAFWSHKLLRWCAPALMALALLANALLLHSGTIYRVTFAAQVAFYCLAFVGAHGLFRGSMRRVASVPHYFVTMNWAIAVGFWRFLRGSQRAAWDRTARA